MKISSRGGNVKKSKVVFEIQFSLIFQIAGWIFCYLLVADYEVAMVVYVEVFLLDLVV